MTATDNISFVLHSQWSQNFDKCDSQMKLPQLSTLQIYINMQSVGLLPYHLIYNLNTQLNIKLVYTEQIIITRIFWIVKFIIISQTPTNSQYPETHQCTSGTPKRFLKIQPNNVIPFTPKFTKTFFLTNDRHPRNLCNCLHSNTFPT